MRIDPKSVGREGWRRGGGGMGTLEGETHCRSKRGLLKRPAKEKKETYYKRKRDLL
jgi:hypothetical protein